jgi:DNA-binding CsgD family transcriptional regulator
VNKLDELTELRATRTRLLGIIGATQIELGECQARIAKLGGNLYNSSGKRPTPRELQIAAHLAQGQRGKDIAQQLSISVKTVDALKGTLSRKLGVHGQLQIAAWYHRTHGAQAA